jgi:hypothetical protein
MVCELNNNPSSIQRFSTLESVKSRRLISCLASAKISFTPEQTNKIVKEVARRLNLDASHYDERGDSFVIWDGDTLVDEQNRCLSVMTDRDPGDIVSSNSEIESEFLLMLCEEAKRESNFVTSDKVGIITYCGLLKIIRVADYLELSKSSIKQTLQTGDTVNSKDLKKKICSDSKASMMWSDLEENVGISYNEGYIQFDDSTSNKGHFAGFFEYLIQQNEITARDLPVPFGRSRYLVNSEPRHRNGKPMVGPVEICDELYVETNSSTARKVRIMHKIVQDLTKHQEIVSNL